MSLGGEEEGETHRPPQVPQQTPGRPPTGPVNVGPPTDTRPPGLTGPGPVDPGSRDSGLGSPTCDPGLLQLHVISQISAASLNVWPQHLVCCAQDSFHRVQVLSLYKLQLLAIPCSNCSVLCSVSMLLPCTSGRWNEVSGGCLPCAGPGHPRQATCRLFLNLMRDETNAGPQTIITNDVFQRMPWRSDIHITARCRGLPWPFCQARACVSYGPPEGPIPPGWLGLVMS
jgi:hypothetical protein